MYGIYTNIGRNSHPNVGIYSIHGAYGMYIYYLRYYMISIYTKHGHRTDLLEMQSSWGSQVPAYPKLVPNWSVAMCYTSSKDCKIRLM